MSTTKFKKVSPEVLMRTLSARTIMLHETVAETMGVNATDLKCMDIAVLEGRDLTAGELADLSGLTTGAITGVIDRLEKANLVRREHDPHDRRRVIIKLTHARDRELAEVFMPMQKRLKRVWSQFTPEEIDAIARYIEACNDIAYERTLELRHKTGHGVKK